MPLNSRGPNSGSWRPGQAPKSPGRPPGIKEKAPRGSVAAIFRQIADLEPQLYRSAIRAALKDGRGRVPALALAAAYIDGRPVERIAITGASHLFVSSMPDMGASSDILDADPLPPALPDPSSTQDPAE